jgi:hypothetical protein
LQEEISELHSEDEVETAPEEPKEHETLARRSLNVHPARKYPKQSRTRKRGRTMKKSPKECLARIIEAKIKGESSG